MAEEPALVWAKERRSPRRQAPSVEQIVRTAITIADAEGLPALSMRRVAADLGSGTASLYRYIASRDDLLDLMIDEVKGAEDTELTGDWRADLASVAHQVRATLLRHPWLSGEIPGRPALGTNSLRRHEAALAAAAPLTGDITFVAGAVDAVLAYVFGTVTQELAELQAQRRSGLTKEQWQASVGPYIREVIESGEYPQFSRRVIEGTDRSAEEVFEFGLGCVLDGIAARVSP
jgi:AcrR family transcriptional regulator